MAIIRSIALASLLTTLAAIPASAEWQDAGGVSFDSHMSHRAARGLDRPVRALEFTARGNDVFCDNVRATFESGRSLDVFSGRLRLNRPTRVDLPGDRHTIRRLDFRCRAATYRADVEIAGDTVRGGWRDRDERWGDDRGPGWDRGGGVVRPDNWGRWEQLSTESFEGRRDRETSSAGWAGRRVEALALRPVDSDARCRRAVVEFANGNRRELDIGRYDVMRRGLFYILDLPGDVRTVVRVDMACRAIGDRDVRIEIWSKAKR